MSELGKILIAGTGPTAVQLAVLSARCGSSVSVAGRKSARSARFFAALSDGAGRLIADVQNEKHGALAGSCEPQTAWNGYETVDGGYDTLILTVSADAYLPVLRSLPTEVLDSVRRIVLVSPTLGSNALVHKFALQHGLDAEVISFSSYLGDTRWPDGAPGNRVLTAGAKRRIYASSTHPTSPALEELRTLHSSAGVDVEIVAKPVDAEARNLSLYTHPPLFMNDFTLGQLFAPGQTPTYIYKLFPEGPITPTVMSTMTAQWREISTLVERLDGSRLNLLKFMLHDSYPVRPESIDSADVERFPRLSAIHQEYLLYVRYASILIDPFSEPDANGRYFDFSAIPIRSVFRNAAGEIDIPRMPREDYYRTKIIQGLAHRLGVPAPTIDGLMSTYEEHVNEFARNNPSERLSDAFHMQDFAADLDLIAGAAVCEPEGAR